MRGAFRAAPALTAGAMLAAAVAVTALSCSAPPLGELVIVITTDMSLPKDIDTIRVEVLLYGAPRYVQDFERLGDPAASIKLPATLGLLAPEDPSEPVTIRVIARRGGKNGAVRVLREVVTTVPPDRIAMLPIPLHFVCDGSGKVNHDHVETTCDEPTHTCIGGTCAPRDVASDALADYAPEKIFGGGAGTGEGSCFDVAACFAAGSVTQVDLVTCSISLDPRQSNVALRTVSDGICGADGCFIALDAGSPAGWIEDSGGVIKIPPAVCDQLTSGKLLDVVAAPVTDACRQKTATLPTCGQWSSEGSGSPPAEPLWKPAAPMLVARERDYTATRIPDGQVLVVGGSNGKSSLLNVERYDPVGNSWMVAAPLASGRESHTATLLEGGKVLIAGGESYQDGVSVFNAATYDPAIDQWLFAGTMSDPRSHHAAALLTNGKVLVVGGSFAGSTAEVYDPELNTWTFAGTTNDDRVRSTLTVLESGLVLAAGGSGVASAELYDPEASMWTPTGSMSTIRESFTATLLLNGKVLVTGGYGSGGELNSTSSAELYDPITGAWTPAAPMPEPRYGHTATRLLSGKVLVAGAGRAAMLYDPTTDTWAAAGFMIDGDDKAGRTATRLLDDRVLITGGTGANDATGRAELFKCSKSDGCTLNP